MNTNELNEQNVTQWLLDYHSDLEIRNLRETYNHPSFFEMMGKDRSETVHSAFLRWLLKSDEFNIDKDYSPLMIFLDLLIRRAQAENKEFNPALKNAILSRNIVFKSIKVETEQNVGDLAREKNNNSTVTIKDFDKVFNSKDRIDIYVECDVENVEGCEKLQIIIENKVGSTEGCEKGALNTNKSGCKEYDELKQTKRYYLACQYKKENLIQLFVYLTPLSSIQLDDYDNLGESYRCSCNEYIQINYQDILDNIIIPLIESPSLPERSRVFLNEYQSTLTIPAIALKDENQDTKTGTRNLQKYLVMACSLKEKENLVSFLQKHHNLLFYSLCVTNSSIYDDEDSNLRCVFKVFLNELMDHCKNREDSDIERIVAEWNACFKEIFEIGDKGKIEIKLGKNQKKYFYTIKKNSNKEIDNINFTQKAETMGFHSIKLLRDFYQKNYRLIIAALKILVDTTNKDNKLSIEPDEFEKWQDLYEQLSNSTDHTKYTLSIDGKKVNGGKSMDKRELVRTLVGNLKISSKDINDMDKSGILYDMNSGIRTTMFMMSFPADFRRYDGVIINNDIKVEPLKDDITKYELYVSNQWGVLNNGKGSFDKLLKFFENKSVNGQKVEIVPKSNNN